MTLLPSGVKVHLALGYIDMRKGIDGLAMLVQGVLRQDPFTGHLRIGSVPGAVIAGVDPEPAGLGAAAAGVEYRDGGVVGKQGL